MERQGKGKGVGDSKGTGTGTGRGDLDYEGDLDYDGDLDYEGDSTAGHGQATGDLRHPRYVAPAGAIAAVRDLLSSGKYALLN